MRKRWAKDWRTPKSRLALAGWSNRSILQPALLGRRHTHISNKPSNMWCFFNGSQIIVQDVMLNRALICEIRQPYRNGYVAHISVTTRGIKMTLIILNQVRLWFQVRLLTLLFWVARSKNCELQWVESILCTLTSDSALKEKELQAWFNTLSLLNARSAHWLLVNDISNLFWLHIKEIILVFWHAAKWDRMCI